ncbi:MAG: hypothetical protein LBD07_04765 [Spirochaetaceae bacterium]|jgi:hypothetical protein|nr:hypothetical protein [Spirochaetaceae bacterium]
MEIYGHSERSLDNAIFDFISALNVNLNMPDTIEFPLPEYDTLFRLSKRSQHIHHSAQRKILFINRKYSYKKARNFVQWAARNKIDEIVLSLIAAMNVKELRTITELAESYHIEMARGGFELSLFVPRRLFIFHKDIFRMNEGRRKRDFNFCPSSSRTQTVIKQNAESFFKRFAGGVKKYYLLPDGGEGDFWCSCHVCRAFTVEEQRFMAVKSAADVLAGIDKNARIVCFSNTRKGQNDTGCSNLCEIDSSLEIICK